jgi:hypothetical protein
MFLITMEPWATTTTITHNHTMKGCNIVTFNFRETNRLPEIPKELKLSIEAQRFPWKFINQSTQTNKATKKQYSITSDIDKINYYLNNIFYDSFDNKPLFVKDKEIDPLKIVTYSGLLNNSSVGIQMAMAREITTRINQALKPKTDPMYKELHGTIHVDEHGYVSFNFKIIKTLNDFNKKPPEKFPEDWRLVGSVLLGENENRINSMELAGIGRLAIWIGFNLLKIWDEEQHKKKIFLYGHGPTMKPNVLNRIKDNMNKVQKIQTNQSDLTCHSNKQSIGTMNIADGGGRTPPGGWGYD